MASPDGRVDLRSDTVTTPTPAMRRAMADAEVGDDVYGEDPTVNHLQETAAALVGKEAALFVPSGTMGNQIALRLLARPGTEVVSAERAHVRQYEAAAAARNAGVQFRTVPDPVGTFTPADLDQAIAGCAHHLPPISLVAIENTHMPSGGRTWSVDALEALAATCRRHDLPLHCDGARIMNAAMARQVTPAQLSSGPDTVMFCLSKGLAAPVGSILAGSAGLIAEARMERSRFGGGMRQAGVIAAAGIVALTEMVERLVLDHSRARRLAVALAECFPGCLDPEVVETNIVCVSAAHLPSNLLDRLDAEGIRGGTIDQSTVRFVTHKDVDDDDLERVRKTLSFISGER
ncbi:MAG: threonine aldolase family protein [Acidimicrobiia bacterium]